MVAVTSIPIYPSPVDPPNRGFSICDLGVNFTEIQYYLPELPFTNHVRQLEDWNELLITNSNFTGSCPLYNISGVPSGIRSGTVLRSAFLVNQQVPFAGATYYPAGTYVFSFDGSGRLAGAGDATFSERNVLGPSSFSLALNNPTTAGMLWYLYATSSTNPFRWTSIYRVGDLSSSTSDTLNQNFINLWKSAKAGRFMDWCFTNNSKKVDASGTWSLKLEVSSWAPVSALWGRSFTGTQSGSRGIVRALDFGDIEVGASWYPSSHQGTWVHYSPVTFTQFHPGETINFGVTSLRMRKASYWGSVGVTGIERDVPASGITSNDINNWLFPQNCRFVGEPSGIPLPYSERIGVPIKTIVDTCNTLNIDCWVVIPNLMSETYISSIALYVRNNLNSHLMANFEHDNEPWNTQFEQNIHNRFMGTVSGFSGGVYTAGKVRYIHEAIRVLGIIRTIFSQTGRSVKTWMNMQATTPADAVENVERFTLNQVSSHGISIAPYFGATDGDAAWYTQGFMTTATVSQILDRLEFTSVPLAVRDVRDYVTNFTQGSGIQIGFYECGQHLTNYFYDPNIDQKLVSALTDPRISNIYLNYFAQLKLETGWSSIPMHYNSMSYFGTGNYWGLGRKYNDPSAYKYVGWLRAINYCNSPPQLGSSSNNAGAKQRAWERQKQHGLHFWKR